MADLASCSEVAMICPGFKFAALRTFEGLRRSSQAASSLCFSIDNSLVYEPFATDFGPINMGGTYRFCQKIKELLKTSKRKGKELCYYCGPNPELKSNAAVLVGAFQVLVLKRTAIEAYRYLQPMQPFCAFRDAASGIQCFELTVRNVIEGLFQAQLRGILSFEHFNLEVYEYCEKVENGDSTWIVPGKLLAFSGPANVSQMFYGYKTKVPEDYCSYFKRSGVSAVIRLNKPLYQADRFTKAGMQHHELYFPDGSCPTEAIVDKFLDIVESQKGSVAIHCKAGLGRTGVLICCYMMKHFQLTAREALGYIRVCRPGSVIGQQQLYLQRQEARMRTAGLNLPHVIAMQQRVKQALGMPSDKNTTGVPVTAFANGADDMGARISKLDIDSQSRPTRARSSRLSSFLRFRTSFSKQTSAPLPDPQVPLKGVARTTAPNGQPRKIPAALLVAGESGLKAFAADEDQPDSAKSDQWRITTGNQEGGLFSPLGAALQAGS